MNKLIEIFPSLSASQIEKFKNLPILYEDWNSKINVISRKDINFFYERHLLHSLGIAKVLQFLPNAKILDVGTGGGFPGIPLAILFPQTHFFLIDSIGKKIKVVEEVIAALDLKNISVSKIRAENFNQKVDFVVSRAVTKMDIFVPWVKKNIRSTHKHCIKNGILYLKGGDLTQELLKFPKAQQFDLAQHFNDDFFEMKKVVYVPL
ncbi:16S rRNA (guanine(527)-N(7))-methyltransferase RsmG [Flavobacteriaceae bacterium]|nr:16S rRNA (guanine(527)-N(7))-methyltransferase RsmG [Flavobacteriaceae bacterium]MDB4062792.1 16S rRNA (guanine(527)-N(7))-methyltransferase RsmG [Flavobacteriaceae bacterium]MDB4255225.1 16S rRNA (guanine(527)-N(7))-methyltransferase RsmG [Flavobacteriaceae bacterium]MDC0000681.1 16S rRNA (guanine(527)-N(7))-methyltransferase RsmG [Flavobacteriaceae bacterium]MDC1391923.1 16S rRNA (guanine(527)-N(7))-methyltransferase RsmG [Flavobacteriaceae bacterium]